MQVGYWPVKPIHLILLLELDSEMLKQARWMFSNKWTIPITICISTEQWEVDMSYRLSMTFNPL